MIPPEILAALRTIEIHTARLANEQLSGTYKSSFKGQGLAFREVRPYQPGDDVRQIGGTRTERLGEAYVKIFREARGLRVMPDFDVSAWELFGTSRATTGRCVTPPSVSSG
jgi:uncharacterized protein (DUF58 family)